MAELPLLDDTPPERIWAVVCERMDRMTKGMGLPSFSHMAETLFAAGHPPERVWPPELARRHGIEPEVSAFWMRGVRWKWLQVQLHGR